jgi:hypothetical protein
MTHPLMNKSIHTQINYNLFIEIVSIAFNKIDNKSLP